MLTKSSQFLDHLNAFQTSIFHLSVFFISRYLLSRPTYVVTMSKYVCDHTMSFILWWIQPLSSWKPFFLSLPAPAALSPSWHSVLYGTLTPPPSFPSILLQSCHPHQHVSGAVWVSINATGVVSPSHWMQFNSTSSSPGSPYPNIDMTTLHVACLPVCLIHWLNTQAQITLHLHLLTSKIPPSD